MTSPQSANNTAIPEAERAKCIPRRAAIAELLRVRLLKEDEFHRYVRPFPSQESAPGSWRHAAREFPRSWE